MQPLLALLLLLPLTCSAQTLLVHLQDEAGHPLATTPVYIRYNFLEARKPLKSELIKQKSDASGNTTFKVDPAIGPFYVMAGKDCDVPTTVPIYSRSEHASQSNPRINPPIETLPGRVDIVIYRRTWGECIRWILSGGS